MHLDFRASDIKGRPPGEVRMLICNRLSWKRLFAWRLYQTCALRKGLLASAIRVLLARIHTDRLTYCRADGPIPARPVLRDRRQHWLPADCSYELTVEAVATAAI